MVPPLPLPPPFVPTPVPPPRLHLHNPGLKKAAYSIGTLQIYLVLRHHQQIANLNTIILSTPPYPNPTISAPTSAATAPSIADATSSPPPLTCQTALLRLFAQPTRFLGFGVGRLRRPSDCDN
jgi:hypothetical protein